MQSIEQALDEVRRLHQEMLQAPAIEPAPHQFSPFPPGVDPVAFAIEEVARLRQIWEQHAPAPTEAEPDEQPSDVQWVPRASIFSVPSGVQYRVEIPGIDREDVSVTVEGGQVIVRGERKPPMLDGPAEPVVVEQPWGAFERRFAVPQGCNPKTATARYEQGMLDIHIDPSEDDRNGEYQVEIG